MTHVPSTLQDGIRAVLNSVCGTVVTVGEPRQLTGGASRQVWAFDAEGPDGRPLPVVLRRDPPGHGDAARMRAEAACLRAAAAAGVPVPTVLASGDSAPGIDAPYLLMNKVEGESFPRTLQRDPAFEAVRGHLAEDMGYVLGLIHRTPLDTLGMLDATDPVDAIEVLYRDLNDPRPAVEVGLRWLREHRPPQRPNTLVHGDFRIGNLLVDGTGIRGVLDWELAHLGDPVEDLGWLCVRAWRFGASAPVAGIGTRDQLLDGYERVTGFRPSASELHWWETFGTLRWLVLSRFQAERHLGGAEKSLELAAIGRRVCESEYDLLDILGLLDDSVALPPPAPPGPTVHDRPRVPEILDLVAETLVDDIGPALAGTQERQRYLLRICVNLLRTAGRELDDGPGTDSLLGDALRAVGCDSEAELTARLREGALPYRDDDVLRAVSIAVSARLRVASPRHLNK
ncbi:MULTISPECIES: phosphotransferase family protein [unclassified Rhodococcus (in: high G+C Gram-positive bacteria)]|uniref:phosphotransferase family protein n=1 Tax=unclassified Rhodococcus (in: high G+C Gram-positive bacteria) TaxID=192944 RepID=UPI0020785E54|nr:MULTISPECIES: phosphotransferase family protein [unclassified Rhodococcus (in: high G+C Gram-positive bacteria)]